MIIIASYKIGTLIKELRKERGISADELSFASGCDTTTLSRIENNKCEPSARVFEAIMVRLGFDPRAEFDIWCMTRDYNAYRSMKELNDLLCQKKYDKAEAYISVLEKDAKFSKGLGRQFLLSSKVTLMIDKNINPKKAVSMVIEALNITISPFNERLIDQYYLSYEEICLVNMLGILYTEIYGHDRGIEVWYRLKDSMDRSFVMEQEKARMYPSIIHNLTKHLGKTGQHEKVIELCQVGKAMCIRQNKLRALPGILINYAYALHYLGNYADSEKYIRQAYCLYQAMDNYTNANNVKEHAHAELGIEL